MRRLRILLVFTELGTEERVLMARAHSQGRR
jgi:hypothetical protein